MATDSSNTPKLRDGQAQPGTPPDDAPVATGLDPATQDVDPASAGGNGEDDEEQLPETIDEGTRRTGFPPVARITNSP